MHEYNHANMYTHTDGQTTKHNATDPVYWTSRGKNVNINYFIIHYHIFISY